MFLFSSFGWAQAGDDPPPDPAGDQPGDEGSGDPPPNDPEGDPAGDPQPSDPANQENDKKPPPDADPAKGVTQACLASFDASQSLRRSRRLVAAKKELVSCSQEACPGVVVVKCQQWLEEVKKSVPSVVIAARDNEKDVFNVEVSVDGVVAYASLTGVALELDPGPRKIVAKRGGEVRRRTVLVREGHKNRVIEFDFTPDKNGPKKPVPVPVPVPEPGGGGGFSMSALSWVGFSVGLAGVIVGSITGAFAISEGDKLQEQCPNGKCPASLGQQFGPGETVAHVSTVSFVVAGAGVALGIIGLFIDVDDSDDSSVSTFGLRGRF